MFHLWCWLSAFLSRSHLVISGGEYFKRISPHHQDRIGLAQIKILSVPTFFLWFLISCFQSFPSSTILPTSNLPQALSSTFMGKAKQSIESKIIQRLPPCCFACPTSPPPPSTPCPGPGSAVVTRWSLTVLPQWALCDGGRGQHSSKGNCSLCSHRKHHHVRHSP